MKNGGGDEKGLQGFESSLLDLRSLYKVNSEVVHRKHYFLHQLEFQEQISCSGL